MVAIETGTRSIWVSEQVRDLGNVSALDADEIFWATETHTQTPQCGGIPATVNLMR